MIQYVLWIAISDTLFAVSTALGYPQPGTASCYAQGSSSIVVAVVCMFIIIVIRFYKLSIFKSIVVLYGCSHYQPDYPHYLQEVYL